MIDPDARLHQLVERVRAHPNLRSHPASAEELGRAEAAVGCRLPPGYRAFQLELGSLDLGPVDVVSARDLGPTNLDARRDAFPPLPPHLIAFSDNGAGDLLCFDTSVPGEEPPIVWWDHTAGPEQVPAPAAPSFLDWLEAELDERDAEPPMSFLDVLAPLYRAMLRGVREP